MYTVVYAKQTKQDVRNLKAAHLAEKAKKLIALIASDPFSSPPAYEKLRGDLAGFYSRRINLQHRLIYEVDEEHKIVKILSMWSHYGD